MAASEKPFFVGYLPMPAALVRFYVPLMIGLCLLGLVAGHFLARMQVSGGPADWNVAATETMSGILQVDPYPVLHRVDPGSGETDSVLLVLPGKFGADDVAQAYSGQAVSITGHAIIRGGWTMLELAGESPIQVADTDPGAPEFDRTEFGTVSLSGEIADSKCFLGVMKPGAGPVHKACAEVCLRGGIPAMLLVRGRDGGHYGYMLVDADGGSLSRDLSSRAAEQVTVSGRLEKQGELFYIRVEEVSGPRSS